MQRDRRRSSVPWHLFFLIMFLVESTWARSRHNATAAFPLHAQAGTHHVHLWVGQPPQKQVVILDTGSRTLALACSHCRHCGKHANEYLDMEHSSTLIIHTCQDKESDEEKEDEDEEINEQEDTDEEDDEEDRNCRIEGADCNEEGKCRVGQKYTEGSSWTALEVSDVIVLGDDHADHIPEFLHLATPVAFGCQYRLQGMFVDQYADGIMGMEPAKHGVMATLSRELGIPYAFSLCLTPHAGYLGIGGSLKERHKERMRFTPLGTGKTNLYNVQVTRVWFGDHELSTKVIDAFNEGKGTVLDSGTTDTYLPQIMEDGAEQVWETLTRKRWKDKYQQYTIEEFQKLPIVTLEFEGGVQLKIKPEHYMEGVPPRQRWSGKQELRKRLYADEQIGAVLGANAMMGYDILHDVENKRMGFARAHCGPDHP